MWDDSSGLRCTDLHTRLVISAPPSPTQIVESTRFLPSKQLLSHLQGLVGFLSALQQVGMGVADSFVEIAEEECMLCR